MTGKERKGVTREVDGDARAIPVVPTAAASEPIARLRESKDLETFHFPREFVRRLYQGTPDPERAILLRVDDESMADDFTAGTIVFVDRGPQGRGIPREALRPGDVYVVAVPGEQAVVLRRVTIQDDLLTLEPGTRDRRRFPLRSYALRGLRIPDVVRGRVVGQISRR